MTKKTMKTRNLGKRNKTFKRMNCNPIMKNKTALDKTCFTAKTLTQIKEAFNEKHENKITTNDPKKLWHDLKDRINNCDKEDCWLSEIHDIKLRETIDKLSFAPDHPELWRKKPNTWLSNYDILKVINQYEEKYNYFKFIGPTPIDFDTKLPEENSVCVWEELCTFSLKKQIEDKITKIGVIFNLDKHNEGGSHWVSLFIDLEHSFIFYFDSAGSKIPTEINNLAKRLIEQGKELDEPIRFTFHENHPFEHQFSNTECGMYALFFIITMLTGKMEKKVFKSFKDIIKLFKTKHIKDEYVFKYRKKYFNSN